MRRILYTFLILSSLVAAPLRAAEPVYFDYQPGVIDDHMRSGKTVVVLFHDFWCQPCKRQRQIITEKRRENSMLNSMVYVVVNWDEYGFMPISDELQVSEVATVLIADRDDEKARMIRVTYEDAITGFLQMGLDW